MQNSRATALTALIVTGLALVYIAVSAIAGWQPSLGWLIQAVIHLGELSAVLALAFSGAAGSGRAGRIGLGLAIAGQAVIAAAEVIWPHSHDLGDVLFSVSPLLTGAGLITAGIAVVRAGAWTGAARFLPLALGLYTILVLIPVMIGSGGPPSPVALWTIGGWDLLWFAVGAVVLSGARSSAPADRSVITVR